MAKYGSISIGTVIEDYLDFSGHEGDLDETWVLKQANDAIERFVSDQQLVHVIEVLNVKDYKVERPPHFQYVIQAAYRIGAPEPCAREEISQFTQKIFGSECELEINIKCPQCHTEECKCDDRVAIEVDVNRIYETAHPEHSTSYMKHFTSHGGNTGRGTKSFYHDQFMLMRKTSTSFYNMKYHIDECVNFGVDCNIEYDITSTNIIVNFKEGEILLAYYATETDADGYRMIPNNELVFKAINWYIEERMAFRNYRKTKEQKDRIFWQQAVEMSEKMIKRARAQLQMPSEDEWWQFIQNHWTKVLPNYRWEKDFNKGKRDGFRYPGQTNNIGSRRGH